MADSNKEKICLAREILGESYDVVVNSIPSVLTESDKGEILKTKELILKRKNFMK